MTQNTIEDLLSIGKLSRKTGIPTSTIRSWERRYGVPEPVRLDSGHRRYRAETVEQLRKLKRALDIGYAPSKVMSLGFAELHALLENNVGAQQEAVEREMSSCVEAALNWDVEGLIDAIDAAWKARRPLHFLEEFAVPLMRRVGHMWSCGDLHLHHEHLISDQLQTYLQGRWRPLANQRHKGRVLCALLPGERHSIGLHMAAALLTSEALGVIWLTPDAPAAEIALVARQTNALGVAISVSEYANLSDVDAHLGALTIAAPEIPVLVGSVRPGRAPIHWMHSYGDLAQWVRLTWGARAASLESAH